ncbi:MAG: hypothetical protein ACI93S_001046, partial [Ancylomarina sp.]
GDPRNQREYLMCGCKDNYRNFRSKLKMDKLRI